MKILQINISYKFGSTGKIMSDLNDVICKSGNNSYMLCGYSNEAAPNLYIMRKGSILKASRKDILISRLSGTMGYHYKKSTLKAIEWIDTIKPDVIHLHNIHGDWINVKILFEYIRKKQIPVVWTLHDCWSFTGRCSHFELFRCEKWKTGCFKCKNRKVYPITYFFDKSKSMWKDKKKWFTSVKKMTIVTPSKWLANYVRQSFLKDYPIKVINNGINTQVYRPQTTCNRYYQGFEGKHIILGVANSWTARKGYYDFIKLDGMIDHNMYQIVLVGLNSRQLKLIPNSIKGIARTENEQELIELYSGATVFVNPTYQDNYPTTNLEAQACGTPCITYRTGGSPESISDGIGCICEQGNTKQLLESIIKTCRQSYDSVELQNYAKEHFDKCRKYEKYIECYHSLVE
jgi:Glycosyltransferase